MSPITLTDDLFLGKGVHRAAYIDPQDPLKCIKILFQADDQEWRRELRYRKSRQRRHLSSTLLTTYYGTVETNLGTGYVFERIVDYDGKSSMDFKDFLEKQAACQSPKESLPFVKAVLQQLKERFFQEKIIVSNMHYGNMLIQRLSKDPLNFSVRIIDNIGSPSHLPLAFYLDFVALRRCKRYWNRYIHTIQHDYPALMPEKLLTDLLV